MQNIHKLKSHKSFDGFVEFWEHESHYTKTKMRFSTYTPSGKPKACIIWLSGLTCNEENFITKAGAQKYLQKQNTMVICPDTSPRGLNLPKEHDHWDFGSGAGFYIDAITEGYADHYQMYSYINEELYNIVSNYFSVKQISIMGHSMGGHGALVIGLRNPNKYQSISVFAPITNPSIVPWGIKAFTGYLGDDKNLWNQYDATELIKLGYKHPHIITIEQGTKDEFLESQLKPNEFSKACTEHGQQLKLNYREGYDHSYYFISSFIVNCI